MWENTHKMVDQIGFTPIKTGWTVPAGCCLATACHLSPNLPLVIVLLNCKDMESRWIETYRLAKYTTIRLERLDRLKSLQAK